MNAMCTMAAFNHRNQRSNKGAVPLEPLALKGSTLPPSRINTIAPSQACLDIRFSLLAIIPSVICAWRTAFISRFFC